MKKVNNFYNMMGGADGEVFVPLKYPPAAGKMKKIKPNSQYNIDYIIYYYNYLITQELMKPNNNKINSSYFQNFITGVSNLSSSVVKARQDDMSYFYTGTKPDDYNYNIGIKKPTSFGSSVKDLIGTGMMRYYIYCDSTIISDAALHVGTITYLMFKQTQPCDLETANVGLYGTTDAKDQSIFNFYFRSFDSPDSPTLINADINDIEESWDNYQNYQPTVSTEKIQSNLEGALDKKRFDQTIIGINDYVKNGEYRDRYVITETILKSMTKIMDSNKIIHLTESELIRSTPDVSGMYENIQFDASDVNGALAYKELKGNDMSDYDTVLKEAQKPQKITTRATAGDLGPLVGLSPSARNPAINKSIQNIASFKSINNPVDASETTLKIMFSFIRKDEHENVVVDYLNSKQRDDEKKGSSCYKISFLKGM